MTRTMLLESVWGFGFSPGTNVLEARISRLRTKLHAGLDGDAIEMARSVGYKLAPRTEQAGRLFSSPLNPPTA